MTTEFIVDATVARIKRLLGELPNSPKALLDGYCDTVSLFVKNEPHPSRKVKTRRWRLISSVSLIDQLIDRLLHSHLNAAEIRNWELVPSCPGIGFTTEDDGSRLLRSLNHLMDPTYKVGARSNERELSQLASGDVRGFDWTVQEWEVLWDAEVRCRLTEDIPDVMRQLIMARAHCLARSVFSTPHGRLLAQTIPGVVKSGTYNTSSTNSRIRAAIAWLAGAECAVTMGDDCIETPIKDAKQVYRRLGHPLREYEVSSGAFEFCSFHFDRDGRYWPLNVGKSIARFSVTYSDDAYYQLRAHFRNHPRKGEVLQALEEARIFNHENQQASAEPDPKTPSPTSPSSSPGSGN